MIEATTDADHPFSPTVAPAEPLGFRLLSRTTARITRSSSVPIALGLVLLFGLGDFVTGVDLTFTLLYLAPICIGAWFRGRAFGVVVSLVGVSLATLGEAMTRLDRGWPLHALHLAWNHGGSLVLFVGVSVLVARLRRFADKERDERRATIEQLRQAERLGVVGQLAAGLAHELGTPLNVIVGHAELIEERRAGTDAAGSAGVILAQAQKMTSIIRGLLDFSRSGGRVRRVVDLGSLVKDASALIRTVARRRNVEVETVVDAGTPLTVLGDRTELEQVLLNLMMNGVQAMGEGGTLRVRLHADEAMPPGAIVEIVDEGAGISAENLPRIFDPFFTTKDVGEGTGLGLAVSYGIVAEHRGRIHVASEVGVGSRFSVRLPRTGGAA